MVPPLAAASSPGGYRDRKGGLVAFGVFTIIGGILSALMVLFMFLGQRLAASSSPSQDVRMLIPAALMYGGLAVLLVWLGIGSIMARRWARALLLIVSWSGLIMGVGAIAMMVWMLPRMSEMMKAAQPPGQPPLPQSFDTLVMIITIVIIGVIFVVLPLVWILFYQSRNVKATCEAFDPVERWTDRSPLPVIALCLWLTLSAAMMLMMGVTFKGVLPAFGIFLTGPLGTSAYILVGLLWLYSAWIMLRLNPIGWWIVFASMLLFCISAFITYSRHDIVELYTLMGYPEKQIAEIQKMKLFEGRNMAWGTLIGAAPFLIYMLYVRKFFSPSENKQASALP